MEADFESILEIFSQLRDKNELILSEQHS